MSRKFREIKQHLNKPTEYYDCELLRSEAGHVVLRYVSDRHYAGTRLGITFPPGCITFAYYWETRPYVFWGIFSPEKELLGYLIHICRDVAISEDSVSYLDMLLDIWFYADGSHLVLDEDEVEACFRSGRLTAKDKEFIEKSKERAIEDFAANAENIRAISHALDISDTHK
jgi:hypothetical protein